MMTVQQSRQEVIDTCDARASHLGMSTYTELRDALAQALRQLPVQQMALLLPVLEKAGGQL